MLALHFCVPIFSGILSMCHVIKLAWFNGMGICRAATTSRRIEGLYRAVKIQAQNQNQITLYFYLI
jgi:hypothetical protein